MSFRHAATLCLVRPADSGLEVLLGKRGAAARFVAGAHVFPGGVVDEIDGAPVAVQAGGGRRDPWKMAAIRETYEEVGILVGAAHHPEVLGVEQHFYEDLTGAGAVVDLDALSYLSTWVTPAGLPFRYDTRFFLAVCDQEPHVDGHEVVDASWISPDSALDRMRRGEWALVSPTVAHLDFLTQFADVDALLAGLRLGRHLERIDQQAVEGRRPAGMRQEP